MEKSTVFLGEMRTASPASNCNRREMDAVAEMHQPSLLYVFFSSLLSLDVLFSFCRLGETV